MATAMHKSQRARLAVLTAQATRSDAEAAEFVTLTALAAQHTDPSKDTDEPAAVTKPTTLSGLLTAGLSTLRSKAAVGGDLAAARAQVTTVTAERDQARTDLSAAQTQVSGFKSQVSALESQLGSLASFFGLDIAALAGKSGAEVSALITSKVNALVTDQVSAIGFPKGELPAPKAPDAKPDLSKGGLLTFAEFSALQQHEKMTFSVAGGRIEG